MRLILRPVDLPFAVGDTVWVDQPYGPVHEFPFFQGTIMQIILDGSLANTLVIRQPKETHELIVASGIYGLKPVGEHAGQPRVNVNVQFMPMEQKFFATKEELLAHQDRMEQVWPKRKYNSRLCRFLTSSGFVFFLGVLYNLFYVKG